MSWKDYLKPDESRELQKADAEKKACHEKYKAEIAKYDAIAKRLKVRCDARMRRSKRP